MSMSSEEYHDVGIIKNDLMSGLDAEVAKSPDWIHHVAYDNNKQQLVQELFVLYHAMRKVVNNSPGMSKFKLNEKPFFNDLLKNVLILVQCCNQFQLSGDDDQTVETNEVLKRFLTESITLVSSYMNEVRNESKRFLDLFIIDEDQSLSHEKVKSGLVANFDKIHEILKPMSIIMSKAASKMSIAKYIFDNYESFKTNMLSIKTSFKSALYALATKNDEYEDVTNETHQVVANFLDLQTLLEKKIRDRNTSSKINGLVSKMKVDMAKIKGKHPDLYNDLPQNVTNFIKTITEAQQNHVSTPNGKKSRKNGLKDDPWSGKRLRKRRNNQKSNTSASTSTDGEQSVPKRRIGRPASLGDNKSEYNEKHVELFTNGQGLLEKLNVLDYTEAANDLVKEMKDKLFAKYEIPEDTQKLVLEKVNLKNMIKTSKKQSSGVACSSSDHVAVDLLESFRKYEEHISSVFDKSNGNIMIPSDYCLRYSDGVFGKNAPYLIIYVFFNFTDVDNPIALKLIPTYTMNKIMSFKTLSVFVMELNHRMQSGKALLLEKPEKKPREQRRSKSSAESEHVDIGSYEQKITDMGVKFEKFDVLKTIPAKMNAKTKGYLKDFLRKNKIDIKKHEETIFPTLFHKKVPAINTDYDLQGAIAQDGRLIKFMCFGNGKGNVSFDSDLYKALEYSMPADAKTTKEVKQLYLYPTCMSIVRRFSTTKTKTSVRPKQYQLFMVYDEDENSLLSKSDKSPFGYVGFIEKNNVFRVIINLNDIDPVTLSMVKGDDEEDIDLFEDDDHSVEYGVNHKHWVHVAAHETAEKSTNKKKKSTKTVNVVKSKNNNHRHLTAADVL